MMWIIAGVIAFAVCFILALCKSAALGDRRMGERQEWDLKAFERKNKQ
jgi:hypothetical protein